MPTADINEVRERTAKRRAGQKFVDKFPAEEARKLVRAERELPADDAAPEFKKVQKEMHKRLPEKMPHVSTGAYEPVQAPIGKRPAKFQPVTEEPTPEEEAQYESIIAAAPAPAAPKAKATRGVSSTDFVFSMRIPVKYERAVTLEAIDEQDAGTFVRKTKKELKLEYLEQIMFQYLEEVYASRTKG